MAKKNKNQENLPEGMSRRQAKLAARAAERAKLAKDSRPYEGFTAEADLIALQEFVPSAHFPADVKGADRKVTIATVLPGAVSALVRAEEEGGEAFVALQTQRRGDNPNRDLAYALNWAKTAKPGESLDVGIADGTEPALNELLDPALEPDITVAQDFNWWLTEEALANPQVAATLQQANDSVLPSERVDAKISGAAWWINPGEKAHIRWVRQDAEDKLLAALARIAAAGKLHLGEDTKFAGAFRTHGLTVPVFDLDPTITPEECVPAVEELNSLISAELSNDAQLNAEERKALNNIKSRQLTIR